MKVEITIPNKVNTYLKKIWGVTDITPKIQNIINDHLKNIVAERFKSKKTINEQIDEINNN